MMDKQEVKDHLYREIAQISKAFANPYRLRILNLLVQSDYSVELIATDLGISIANASQHLQVLKKNRLLTMKKKDHFVIYYYCDFPFLWRRSHADIDSHPGDDIRYYY